METIMETFKRHQENKRNPMRYLHLAGDFFLKWTDKANIQKMVSELVRDNAEKTATIERLYTERNQAIEAFSKATEAKADVPE